MQFMFAARRGRHVFQRLNLQQTATLSTRVPIAVSSVRRVFRLAGNRTASVTKGTNHTIERFSTLQKRCYAVSATETEKKTKKATRKRTKKTTKKPTARKARKKLTPEQLEKKRTRQKDTELKKEIMELKEKSLRNEEPKIAATQPRNIYLKQQLQGYSGKDVPTAFKNAADEFKSLSPFQLQELEHQSANIREENKRKYTEWVNSYTPLQIKNANQARRRLALLTAEHRKRTLKYPPIKDERLVKKPSGEYIIFATELSQQRDFKQKSVKERSALVKLEWDNLPAAEKERYVKLAAEDRERYISQYREVYGEEPRTVLRSAKSE